MTKRKVMEVVRAAEPTPTKRRYGRPRMLDGETCYVLFTRLGSIGAVRQYLFQAGVIAPGKSGKFTNSSVQNAILKFKPDANVGDMMIRQAQMNMAKLRQQVLATAKS